MARVNVDSQALTDARFLILANLMGSDDPDLALGRMLRLWMQCTDRETPTLPPSIIIAVFRGAKDAPTWLVEADLAEPCQNGVFRIKGTSGRIEWLAKKRANGLLYGHLGAKHGIKGGRPRKGLQKPHMGVNHNPITGGVHNPPPALALAPYKENPLPPLLDTPEFREAWQSWIVHRSEIKKKLTPSSAARQLKMLAKIGLTRAIACIEHTIEKGWTGLREPEADQGSRNSRPQAEPIRPVTSFEMAHGRYNGQTGFARDSFGNIICDRICKDPSCEHCKSRRGEVDHGP